MDRILHILKKFGVEAEIRQHKPVFTVEEAASARGCRSDEILKVMVLLYGQSHPLIALVPGDRKIDLKKIAESLGIPNARLADKRQIRMITGFDVGAVPPFGYKRRIKTFLDESVIGKKMVHCSTGLHTAEMILNVADLINIVQPDVRDIIKTRKMPSDNGTSNRETK